MYKVGICSCLAVISDSVCATFEVCCLANCTTKNIKNVFWHAELNFEICNSSPLQSGQLNSESTFTHSLTIAPEKWWCFCVTIFISVKHWLIFCWFCSICNVLGLKVLAFWIGTWAYNSRNKHSTTWATIFTHLLWWLAWRWQHWCRKQPFVFLSTRFFDHRHLSLKVQNVEFEIYVSFSTLMHPRYIKT